MIKDLYFAIIKAYKEVYAQKIEAKKKIKEIKYLMNVWENRTEDIKEVENLLISNWEYLPVKQRKDYIQKIIDLIHYGFNVEYYEDGTCKYHGSYTNGLKKIYKSIVDTLASYFDVMKSLYKRCEYNDIIKVYDECIDHINSIMELYGITENQTNNE